MWQSKVLNTSEGQEQWKRMVDAAPTADIYFTPEYAMVFETTEGETRQAFGGEANLFFFGDEHDYIIYPFFKRRISELPFSKLLPPESNDWCDIVSPYGFSGPLASITETESEGHLWEEFIREFHIYCLKTGIVAEFARLNPYLRNDLPLGKLVEIEKRSKVVYIDLEQEETEIKRGMSHGKGNKSSKASRSGVEILRSKTKEDINGFYQLYIDTMERNRAKESYFFSREFFDSLFQLLERYNQLFGAWYKGQMIAASLFLFKKDIAHYYLSGSHVDFRSLRPNNLILHEAILWAKEQGYKTFNLGGGYEPNDSLFQFKTSFSDATADFYTYSRVHNEEMYRMLCQARDNYDGTTGREPVISDYFPKYRR